MQQPLYLYNTISRKKELFEPLYAPFVGMYVCGPTVYGDAHLGHARPAITFDLLFRYLKHLGYKVRYVRNITDVGHLENDADEGEDKIAKKARLEQLEPMELVQYYTNRYHKFMDKLNVLLPSIEPLASGHIIEQIQFIERIIDAGFAYESNGSVYFDVLKYNKKFPYGKLSGRVLDDLLTYTRELTGQHEKKNNFDFALWKKADAEHIMHWPSKWSEGFPGWHLECSVMSTKYLGEVFDIHGGGMDLLFPHHECEIAQSTAVLGKDSVRYWIHNNMITINGQKMGKSLNNFITLEELFSGAHKLLDKAYSPMTIRFFILQAQYRSTLDFSNEALQGAEKGVQRLMNAIQTLDKLNPSAISSIDVKWLQDKCYEAMNDDLNSPVVIANLFEGVRWINSITEGTESISAEDLKFMKSVYQIFVFEILGLTNEISLDTSNRLVGDLINMLLTIRNEAKSKKDFQTSDQIRNELAKLGVVVKDKKDGFDWEIKEIQTSDKISEELTKQDIAVKDKKDDEIRKKKMNSYKIEMNFNDSIYTKNISSDSLSTAYNKWIQELDIKDIKENCIKNFGPKSLQILKEETEEFDKLVIKRKPNIWRISPVKLFKGSATISISVEK